MSKLVLPKATTAAREAATPVAGEIFYDQGKQAVFFGDGATPGGIGLRAAALSTAYVYGRDYDTTAITTGERVVLNHDHDTDGDPLRYSRVDAYAQMPAHHYPRCVMSNLANRTVAYYLSPSDSTKKANGQAAVLTGADGDVMQELPVCHSRLDTYTDSSGHVHNVSLVSNRPFTGSAVHPWFFTGPGGATARVQYVGAFRSVLCDSTGAVVPQSTDGTPATYTAGCKFRSIAGARAHGGASRANYRTGAAANGGDITNALFGQYLLMMMAIDGGTFDTQAGISVGYSQLSAWDYAAVRKTGRTACFGNGTGEVLADDATAAGADYDLLTMATGGGTLWNTAAQANSALKVVQFSYRGLEDPFGSQGCVEDGIQRYQNEGANDYSQSGYWITNDTTKYPLLDTDRGAGAANAAFPAVGYTGASYVWVAHPWPKANGYVGGFDPKSCYPIALGGSSTTYLGDYFYNDAGRGASPVIRGGTMDVGAWAGAGYVLVHYVLSAALAYVGSRLAC